METSSAAANRWANVERASKPSQPKGIGDRTKLQDIKVEAIWASKPSQPKGIGDASSSMTSSMRIGWGIKAISAERHWRLGLRLCSFLEHMLASKPSQPKGIGDDVDANHGRVAEHGHQSHLSRKALETCPLRFSSPIRASGHQSHLSRKALETYSCGCGVGVLACGIKAISAERHWRLRLFGDEPTRLKGGHQSHLSRKALETRCCVCLVSGWPDRHQSHLSRKALETGRLGGADVPRIAGIKAISAERHWRPNVMVM